MKYVGGLNMEKKWDWMKKPIKESVWCAYVHYIDGTSHFFPIKNPHNMQNLQNIDEKSKSRIVKASQTNRYMTRTGLLQSGIFTIKEAHYFAFAQAGFAVKNIELMIKNIEFDPVTQKVIVL